MRWLLACLAMRHRPAPPPCHPYNTAAGRPGGGTGWCREMRPWRISKQALLALLMLFAALPAAAKEQPDPRIQVEAAMADSAEGWNRGDLDAFLAIYADDPGTSFTGAKGIERGLGPIRARYAKNYADQFGPGERPKRTVLSFGFEDFKLIGRTHAHLIARWTLTPAAGGAAQTGMTSLIFRREARGWKIVADHSS